MILIHHDDEQKYSSLVILDSVLFCLDHSDILDTYLISIVEYNTGLKQVL